MLLRPKQEPGKGERALLCSIPFKRPKSPHRALLLKCQKTAPSTDCFHPVFQICPGNMIIFRSGKAEGQAEKFLPPPFPPFAFPIFLLSAPAPLSPPEIPKPNLQLLRLWGWTNTYGLADWCCLSKNRRQHQKCQFSAATGLRLLPVFMNTLWIEMIAKGACKVEAWNRGAPWNISSSQHPECSRSRAAIAKADMLHWHLQNWRRDYGSNKPYLLCLAATCASSKWHGEKKWYECVILYAQLAQHIAKIEAKWTVDHPSNCLTDWLVPLRLRLVSSFPVAPRAALVPFWAPSF